MNPKQLLQHFDRVSEATDAIVRLRRFILDLAVRGKLVEQDPNDEPAAELLKRIQSENNNVANVATFLADNELPFQTPSSWMWVPIGNATYVEMGQSPPSENYNQSRDGLPFFQGKADFGKRNPTPRYWCNQPTKLAKKNDILMSVRAPVGPTNVASEECCIGRGLAALRPHKGVDLELLLYWLKAFEPKIAEMGFGTTFVAINKKQLISFPLPLPPLAEQHRIVAKVDELMELCDQLHAAQTERELSRDRLVAASLHRIGDITQSRHSGRDCRTNPPGADLHPPKGCRAGQPGMNPEHRDMKLSEAPLLRFGSEHQSVEVMEAKPATSL
ncbi:MAG: restriction endonuclease subunit S [Methylococcales bacterium]|nr:restriction endonuclease subunit S [Methylococcales bacterium]